MRRLIILLWRMSRDDLKFLWFALRHPLRPRWLWPAALVLTTYALSPVNFAMPLIGVIDDMIIVPLVLHWLLQRLPIQLHTLFRTASTASTIASTRFRDSV
jgi:uncharacterized membrane protein YkvA (DUF1232 family)